MAARRLGGARVYKLVSTISNPLKTRVKIAALSPPARSWVAPVPPTRSEKRPMPPLDMQACGVSVESRMNSSTSSSLRSLVDAAASTLGGHEDLAGERRRTRALKLRQTRTRNAARAQAYTSAEDSEEEVRQLFVVTRRRLYPFGGPCLCLYETLEFRCYPILSG